MSDLIIRMKPKTRKIKLTIKSVKKAEPRIIREDYENG